MPNYKTGSFDIYDDGGVLLRKVVPDSSDIPEFVKIASAMSQGDNANLFALVLVDAGKTLKKYATADRGNTWLSTLYFSATRDKLPPEAQKVAAANLIMACEAHDIAPPDLLFDYADGPIDTNLVDVTGQKPMQKIAEEIVEKKDVLYAIERADGSRYYPLEDNKDTAAALDYFERNVGDFVPRERREFAVKTASMAKKAGMEITPAVRKYSREGWNPSIEAHITSRYVHLTDAGADIGVKDQLMKLAQDRGIFEPEEFAYALEAFDRSFGLDNLWDSTLADPWVSVTGDFEKLAKGSVPSPRSWDLGEVHVTEEELQALADKGQGTLTKAFGDGFARAFLENPVQQFTALPTPSKKFLARLATSHGDDRGMG